MVQKLSYFLIQQPALKKIDFVLLSCVVKFIDGNVDVVMQNRRACYQVLKHKIYKEKMKNLLDSHHTISKVIITHIAVLCHLRQERNEKHHHDYHRKSIDHNP